MKTDQLIKDRIEAVNMVFNAIRKNINASKKTFLKTLVNSLDEQRTFYNKSFLNFTQFIDMVIRDSSKGFFTNPKLKEDQELKDIILKLLSFISVVISKGKVQRDVEDYIKKSVEFKITNKETLNILNLLINYKNPITIDTLEFLEVIVPDFYEKRLFTELVVSFDKEFESAVDAEERERVARSFERQNRPSRENRAPRPKFPFPAEKNKAEPKTRRSARRSTRRTRRH
jgi:hypothetical protein